MPTDYRVPCLMTDPIYRMGIVWQNVGYNQPPHLSYYLPEAETTLYVGNCEETIYYTPGELTNYTPSVIGEATVTWSMSSGTLDEQPTITGGFGQYFGSSNITIGNKLTLDGTVTAGAHTETLFTQTSQKASASDANAIDLMVALKDGYTFTPTKIELVASRVGSSYPRLALSWLDGSGFATFVADGIQPAVLPSVTEVSENVNSATPCSNNTGVRINYYTAGKVENKSVGLCNIRLTGTITSMLAPVTGLADVRRMKEDVRVSAVYDLQGRRVSCPQQKGIYIINGKKVVIK